MTRIAAILFSALAFASSHASANVIFEWIHVSGTPASLRVELTDSAVLQEGATYFRTFEYDQQPRPTGCESVHTGIVKVSGGWGPNTFGMSPSSGHTGWTRANISFKVLRNGYLSGYIDAHTDETQFIANGIGGAGTPLWGITYSQSDRSFQTCFSFEQCGSLGYLVATTPIPEIPEPGTVALLGLAVAGLAVARSRKPNSSRT